MKKKWCSLWLVIIMIFSSFQPATLWAKDQSDTKVQLAEEMISNIKDYYEKDRENVLHKMSRTQFAVTAAQIESSLPTVIQDETTYNYENRFAKGNYSYNNHKNWADTLALIDKIFDGIAKKEDIEPLIQKLLDTQKDNGWFDVSYKNGKATLYNLAVQARAILAIEAYYGGDLEQEWPNAEKDSHKGRLGAIKVVLENQNPPGTIGGGCGGFSGICFSGRKMPNPMFGSYNVTRDDMIGTACVLEMLASYRDSNVIVEDEKKLGECVKDVIEKALLYIDCNKGRISFTKAYYLIPAFVAIGRQDLIEEYKLLDTIEKQQLEDGSFSQHNREKKDAKYFDTQQVLIALSDIIANDSSYRRIVSPRVKSYQIVNNDLSKIVIPTQIEVNSESIQAGNKTAVIELPTIGKNGTQIVWDSSDAMVIRKDGLVTFPKDEIKKVILTAKATYKTIIKEKSYEITVKSIASGQAMEALTKRAKVIQEKYGTDISTLGKEGIFALANIDKELATYIVCELKEADNVKDGAMNVMQLIFTGYNPYNYHGSDYIDKLEHLQENTPSEYSSYVLTAFDAAGRTPKSSLIREVANLAANKKANIIDRALAVSALSSSMQEEFVKQKVDEAVLDLKATQVNGRFGNSIEEHAYIIAALIDIGEELFASDYIQDGKSVLTVLDKEEEDSPYTLHALGDMVQGKSLWKKIKIASVDLDELIKKGQRLYDEGIDTYSPDSLLILKTALADAKEADNDTFGKAYFDLRAAIQGLTMGVLPEISDIDEYTIKSAEVFTKSLEGLESSLLQKTITVKELEQAADNVKQCLEKLEKIPVVNTSKKDIAIPKEKSIIAVKTTTLQSSLLNNTSKQAKVLFNSTSKGFDKYYQYDISQLSYWGVFDVAAMGKDLSLYQPYDVTKHKNGLFSTYQATDYAAIIIQLILIGENPYNYQNINYVEKLQAIDREDIGYFGPYANNIWALMALDAAGAYYSPKLLENVKAQVASASFDLDMCGWGLCALANHRDNLEVEKAIQSALSNLETIQIKKGKFAGYFKHPLYTNNNVNTHVCVISGLVAVGEDITSERWTKDGQNPLDILKKFQSDSGEFYYTIIDGNKYPSFNKDAVIALGDAVQGSNIWQRTYLDKQKCQQALKNAQIALQNAPTTVSAAKKKALETAIRSMEEVSDIKGNGDRYFRLLEAAKNLTYIAIPIISDGDQYTYNTFAFFKLAVKNCASLFTREQMTVAEIQQSCECILKTYKDLRKSNTQGGGDIEDPSENIEVSFTLLGDEKHDYTLCHTYENTPKQLKTWIRKTKVVVPENATVFDVFDKVLSQHNIKYEETQPGYIGFIKSPNSGKWIGEFTNGPLSGWMYIVNGVHSSIGLRKCTLEDGDDIIWHYTDNYTKEEDSQKWIDKIEEENKTVDALVKVESTKVVEQTAIVTLTNSQMSNLLKQLDKVSEKENAAAKIAVDIPKCVTGVQIEINKDIIKELAKTDHTTLELYSDLTSAKLDAEMIKMLAEELKHKDLIFTLKQESSNILSKDNQKIVGTHPVYQFTMTINDQFITHFKQGTVQISIPYMLDKQEQVKDLMVYCMDSKGNVKKIKDAYYDESKKRMFFTTNHFSIFVITNEVLKDKQSSTERTKKAFDDIANTHWASEAIYYLRERGIMQGTSNTKFSPNKNITRAEWITILARMSEDTLGHEDTIFEDVNASNWYYNNVCWGVKTGIVKGMGATTFAPNDNLSRQEMAVTLLRYIEYKKILVEEKSLVGYFKDENDIAKYAKNAVMYMRQKGIIQGKEDGMFGPRESTTRAQAAQIIANLLQNNK